MDKKEFMSLMKELNIAYGDRKFPLDDDVLRIWYKYLQCLEIENMRKAVEWSVKKSPFPPSISELMEFYYGYVNKEKVKVKQCMDMYFQIVGIFPMAKDTDQLKELFGKFTKWDIGKANILYSMVRTSISEWERRQSEHIPTLEDYIGGLIE